MYKDGLDHDTFAGRVLETLRRVPLGSVIALHGPWGRGKTDVLARLGEQAKNDPKLLQITVNPWRHGSPDLLRPLILGLLRLMKETAALERRELDIKAIHKALLTILAAGTGIGLKIASRIYPGFELLGEVATEARELVKGLGDAHAQQFIENAPEIDAELKLGESFVELTREIIGDVQPERRIICCIDDLDRCPPKRQVGFLEALFFLQSPESKAVFLVAVDPMLAREAVRVYYGAAQFNVDRYLDKMFQLRVYMPGLQPCKLTKMVRQRLDEAAPATGVPLNQAISLCLGAENLGIDVCAELSNLTEASELRNPRVLDRLLLALELLTVGSGRSTVPAATAIELRMFLKYLALTRRWPEVRYFLQACASSFYDALVCLHECYIEGKVVQSAQLKRLGIVAFWDTLPPVDSGGGLAELLGQMFALETRIDVIARHLERFEDYLVACGV